VLFLKMKLVNVKIMFLFLSISLVTLLTSNIVNATQRQFSKVDARIVTINSIKLGDREKEIVAVLGKPNKIALGFSEAVTKKTKTLYFYGLTIYLSDDSILNLSCTKNCMTNKGIKIGSSLKQVINAYGKNAIQNNKVSYIFWTPKGYIDAHLVFYFKQGVVIKIEYWINYV